VIQIGLIPEVILLPRNGVTCWGFKTAFSLTHRDSMLRPLSTLLSGHHSAMANCTQVKTIEANELFSLFRSKQPIVRGTPK
jgi:hypothetical protein